jgi:hypothetical protein
LALRRRVALWGAAAALLLLPLLAMQVSDEVDWDAADFMVFGAMLALACGAWEAAARRSGSGAYRAGVGVAVAAGFLLVWVNLAVGVIGTEDDPANLMFAGVLTVAIGGAAAARARPGGLARAMLATALAQVLVAAVALVAGMRGGGASPPAEVIGLSAGFAGLWLVSARLFRRAAREEAHAG